MLCYLQSLALMAVLYALNRLHRFRGQGDEATLFRGLYLGSANGINIFPAAFVLLENAPDGWPTLATLLGLTALTGAIAMDTTRICWKLAPLSFLNAAWNRLNKRNTLDR